MKLVNINANEVVFDNNKIEVDSCKTMNRIETESYILSSYSINGENKYFSPPIGTKQGLYFMDISDNVLEEAVLN
ncbi:hypothetical protein [Clostridium sp.]|uniref:hypothetical protein n=1 Tax=Clostridium sp. TaxID=1506 RepID=UPI0029028288|nr:hypothetical protein [Clostridium sp.]MBS7132446.1 hypothetical protein [Clostridium sp.]MDU2285091.1 hypothetical protein [Clostridium sp.]